MITQPPFGGCHRLLIAIPIAKTAPHRHTPMARCIAIAKNRRSAVIYVSTGLARLPRDAMSAHRYRRSAVV
uniref:hypothetical protein n=1 Tax=Candidatus Limisoma sp. TaxID=3076476 RepID=UPI00402A1A45